MPCRDLCSCRLCQLARTAPAIQSVQCWELVMCVLKCGGFVWPVIGGGCGEQRGVVGATGVATLASILARAQAVVVVVVFVSKLLDVRSMQLPASAELNHCQRFPVTSPPGFVCISHSRLLHMLSPFLDGHASRAASVSPSSAACRALFARLCVKPLPRPVREETCTNTCQTLTTARHCQGRICRNHPVHISARHSPVDTTASQFVQP